jgi:hypothetical protein
VNGITKHVVPATFPLLSSHVPATFPKFAFLARHPVVSPFTLSHSCLSRPTEFFPLSFHWIILRKLSMFGRFRIPQDRISDMFRKPAMFRNLARAETDSGMYHGPWQTGMQPWPMKTVNLELITSQP